jgi:predicted  nucleic acid-binding Zn-ribbon protein
LRQPSPGALAVAKDKRYALSGPSPGSLAVAKDRDNTKSKTESCAFHWSRPGQYYLELTHCAGRRQFALAVVKDKRYAVAVAVAVAIAWLRWPSPKIKDTR